MAERIYRIDKKKELKTVIVSSVVILMAFSILFGIVYAALGFLHQRPAIGQVGMIIIFLVTYAPLQYIIIRNSQTDINSWSFQILDDDRFTITNTRHQPVTYAMSELSKIDMREDETLFVYVRNPRKKVFIHNNLEKFPEIAAYFNAMKQRMKANAPTV